MSLSGFRNRLRPGTLAWITALWCLLMGQLSAANLIGGFLVACVVVFALPLPSMPMPGKRLNYLALARVSAIWLVDLVKASVSVAWLAIRPQPLPATAIITVPLHVDNEFLVSLAVGLYNLQPGGTVTDIDLNNRLLTIHVLDAGGADGGAALDREARDVAKLAEHLAAIFERP